MEAAAAIGDNLELENVSRLRLPPFWSSNPEIWFTQIECQFNLSRIHNEKTKYNLVITHLPTDIISTIIDIVQNPPEVDAYQSLKKF